MQAYIAPEEYPGGSEDRLAKLRAACIRLADNPHLGHRREDLTDQSVLFWPVRAYYVSTAQETQPLEIVRIVHSARDIPHLL